MTDLEMTELCAVAMGFQRVMVNMLARPGIGANPPYVSCSYTGTSMDAHYDPFHNDAQLLALARRFPYEFEQSVTEWCNHLRRSESFDLSHYFCERIAEKTHGL